MASYSKPKKPLSKEAIIGLGEDSIRKNYYPELQDKVSALEQIRARNKALMMAIPDILLVSNRQHHFTPFSASGREEAALVMQLMRSKSITELLIKGIDEVFENRKPQIIEFTINSEKGTKHYEARFQQAESSEVLIIIRDMTNRVLLENQLRDLAERDSSTGLYNRRKFEEAMLGYEINPVNRLTLLIYDIDGLKNINDTLGHTVGDQVIKQVANHLNATYQDAKIISRIGGNEFAILYEVLPLDSILQKHEVFEKALSRTNELSTFKISVSYGMATTKDNPLNASGLYQTADHNLFNHKLLKQESSKSNLVKTLMKALEAKDYVTEGHTDRMGELAYKLGIAMKLPPHRLDRLILLTKFHDLGKVGIPDSILKKPGPLTDDEWVVMKTHTAIGQRIAAASPELETISDLIYKHHEKWDGTGYPLGLSGSDIPLECRILSLVDSYDAMTNDRPYRKALSLDSALAEIRRCSGTQFDPDLVDLFETYLNQLE
ncbi:MAG: hypothetical protein BGO41_09725 [Clostridiales bacterium 38-18]|nr:MAG: hypothetical protein BGO41_09725 [Clostridiales bacterium 38-18]